MTGPRYPHAIFCPAEPVLDYLIESYTNSSMNGHIISVDDVCTFSLHILRHTRQLLANLRANPNINPEAAAFIGLYRLLPTRPPNLATSYLYHFVKSTPSFPLQRIRMGTTFVLPSANQATDPLVPKYRIYDALGTPPQVRVYAPEIIPLYNTNLPQFNEQHWRLGRSEGLILAFFHVHVSPTLDFQRQSPIHAKLCRLLHFMEERLAPSTQSSFRISNTSRTAVPLAPAIDLESLYENPRTPQSGRDDFNTFSLLNESSVSPGAVPSPVIRSPTPLLTHSSHPGQEDLTEARLSEIQTIEKNEIVERYLNSCVPDDESKMLLRTWDEIDGTPYDSLG